MKYSISQLAAITEKDRRTVTDRLKSLDFQEGPNREHLYDSADALAAIYESANPRDELDKARVDEIRQRMETSAKKRIPIEIPLTANDQAIQSLTATLKAARNKKLTPALINELLAKVRAIPAQLDVSQW